MHLVEDAGGVFEGDWFVTWGRTPRVAANWRASRMSLGEPEGDFVAGYEREPGER
jgi:hypothetical protein